MGKICSVLITRWLHDFVRKHVKLIMKVRSYLLYTLCFGRSHPELTCLYFSRSHSTRLPRSEFYANFAYQRLELHQVKNHGNEPHGVEAILQWSVLLLVEGKQPWRVM